MEEPTPLSGKEKVNIFLPLLLALALAGGTWLGFELANKNNNTNSSVVVGKMEEILRFIDARYLENEDEGQLEDIAINSLLDKLLCEFPI